MEISIGGASSVALRAAEGKGDRVPMGQPESCSRIDCSGRVVTRFADEPFCLDHFCSRCYDLLERGSQQLPQPADDSTAALLYRLEEGAQRALEISLGESKLNNLDRARLLDILLWSGDVTTVLRQRRLKNRAGADDEEAPREPLERASGRGRLY